MRQLALKRIMLFEGGLVRNNNNLTIIVKEHLFGCGCRGFVKGTQYFICDACV